MKGSTKLRLINEIIQQSRDACVRFAQKRPLFVAATLFAVGIFTARSVKVSLTFAVACAVINLVSAMTLARMQRTRFVAAICLMITIFCTGSVAWLRIETARNESHRLRAMLMNNELEQDEVVELEGTLGRAPEAMPDGVMMLIDVESLRARGQQRAARGRVQMFASIKDGRALRRYENLDLQYGARLRIACRVRREAGFRNPGVVAYADVLDARGIDATTMIKSPLLIERLEDGSETGFFTNLKRNFLRRIFAWRANLLARIAEVFSPDTAAILNASLLGNERYISRAVAERFRVGGTFHILVISGMQISIIGGAVLWLMGFVTRRSVVRFALAIVLLWSFAFAVGAESSVMRASLMFGLAAGVATLKRSVRSLDALNVLGAAALALLVWRAEELFNPSFHLTFLSVFALICVALPLVLKLQSVGEWTPSVKAPHPPACAKWFRTLGESLFWSERKWRDEQRQAVWTCRVVKSKASRWLEWWRVQWLWRFMVIAFISSACVQIVMLPLMVIYFHRFSLAAFALNIWTGALFALMAGAAIVALLLMNFNELLAMPFIWLTERTGAAVTFSVDPFVKLGLTQQRVAEYTNPQNLLYVIYAVLLLWLIRRLSEWNPLARTLYDSKFLSGERARVYRRTSNGTSVSQILLISLAICLGLILWHPLSAKRTGSLRVDFLDVGQGDAALITFPDATTMLVDAGGKRAMRSAERPRSGETFDDEEAFEPDTPRIGEAVVSNYLWHKGLSRVDYIVATHADTDHIQGLVDVMRNFTVRAAFVGREATGVGDYDEFATTAKNNNVPILSLRRGDELKFGNATIEVLHPAQAVSKKTNDDSIALRVTYGERSLLLTGDVESDAEANIINSASESLRADVVKVAHHGSRTSSTASFVNRVMPQIAVVSAPRLSPFGHPHKEIVERWRAAGARVLTTGESGMISVITDGRELKIEEYATAINNVSRK